MLKMTRVASVATLAGIAAGGCLLGFVSTTRALTTSDKPASIIIWPKIVVDTAGKFGSPTNTLIQLSNTARSNPKQAHCFYINANSHCVDNGDPCETSLRDCGRGSTSVACVPGWTEIDFDIVLTPDQPLGWYASDGLSEFPLEGPGRCTVPQGRICFRDGDCGVGGTCNLGLSNLGSAIPPVPEDPFIGTLKCIQFDPSTNPPTPDHSGTKDVLKGEASILVKPRTTDPTTVGVDVQKYNAVGIQATGTNTSPSNVLQLGKDASGGTTNKEYEACATTLILNHLFDGATDPLTVGDSSPTNTTVTTDLTLVPCGDDFLTQTPGRVTAQFLVFNEFEQRFSTSRTVDCFLESQLSLIDTRTSTRSIFHASVSGTIAGQTRIRGVGDAPTGRGLVGVARLLVNNSLGVPAIPRRTNGAGYNLHQQGNPPDGTAPDLITLP